MKVAVGDGKAVWVGTPVAVEGVVGEGGRAVGNGIGVAAGVQAERSRVARRVKAAKRAKRGPVKALHQGQ
jgi:hypothetical protein